MHEQPVAFKIKRIEVLNSSLKTPEIRSEVAGFNFEVGVRQGVNAQDKIVLAITSVSVYPVNSKELLGSFEAAFSFELEDFDNVFPEPLNMEVPDSLSMALNSISISTTRGLMFNAFKGTYLHNAILPLVDPLSLQPALIE
jgi:hypothetical protein